MKKALLIALFVLPFCVFAQGDGDKTTPAKQQTIVTVTAKGADVRGIIADLFAQAKQNYVLQPGISFSLFLSLDKIDFEEALNIICTQAKLQFEVQNGIYFISKAKATVAPTIPAKPKGTLDKEVLARRLTTKLAKTDIRVVFAEFAKQTDVTIEIDKSVPNFKLDAFLTKTSLRYALEKVTEATGLKYKLTDNLSILIYKPEDGNKVSISG